MNEKPKIRKLDFSRFHALDHRWWELRRCWSQPYGKSRVHASYWWQYKSPWAMRRFRDAGLLRRPPYDDR